MSQWNEEESLAMILGAPVEPWRTELAARESNGISVRLFWSRSTNLLTVTVADASNGDYFELVLEGHERPLEAFYHPYAYAAARGVEYQAPQRPTEVFVDG
jgi:hypothetical protein